MGNHITFFHLMHLLQFEVTHLWGFSLKACLTLPSISRFEIKFQRNFSFLSFILLHRTLVLPYDLGRFDAMVSAHEKEALEYLNACVPGMFY